MAPSVGCGWGWAWGRLAWEDSPEAPSPASGTRGGLVNQGWSHLGCVWVRACLPCSPRAACDSCPTYLGLEFPCGTSLTLVLSLEPLGVEVPATGDQPFL